MRWISLPAVIVLLGLGGWVPLLSQAEETGAAVKDAFFAGLVVEFKLDKVTVSRTVLGKNESRTFAVTADTKVEGRLGAKARVTVRYTSDDSGDTAVLIVVRKTAAAKKK